MADPLGGETVVSDRTSSAAGMRRAELACRWVLLWLSRQLLHAFANKMTRSRRKPLFPLRLNTWRRPGKWAASEFSSRNDHVDPWVLGRQPARCGDCLYSSIALPSRKQKSVRAEDIHKTAVLMLAVIHRSCRHAFARSVGAGMTGVALPDPLTFAHGPSESAVK